MLLCAYKNRFFDIFNGPMFVKRSVGLLSRIWYILFLILYLFLFIDFFIHFLQVFSFINYVMQFELFMDIVLYNYLSLTYTLSYFSVHTAVYKMLHMTPTFFMEDLCDDFFIYNFKWI